MDELPATNNPFRAPYVRRASTMMFNLTTYAKYLLDSFVAEGGASNGVSFTRPRSL